MKQHRKKRTDVDFSKHIIKESHFKCDVTGHTSDIWEIRLPATMWYRVIFINSCGILTVDGDYGRYSFCREFHPSEDGYVSDSYWEEKLRIGNDLVWDNYDSEETEKQLKKFIDTDLEEYGYEGKELEKLKEQLSDLLEYVEDRVEYMYYAFRGDIDLDYELIPYVKEHNVRLDIIFDAFEEICNRVSKKEIEEK